MNTSHKKIKSISTIHDFGLCSSVNRGIKYILNHKNNFFKELSLLPNAPGSEEAAKFAKDSKISTNLCLNFTSFKPLSKNVPSLVNREGNFYKPNIRTWDFSDLDKFEEEDIDKELEAQWKWFVKNVGRKPSAIVTRKNEYGDPKFLIPVTKKAKQEKVAVRTPVWKWRENYAAESYVNQERIPHPTKLTICLEDWNGRFGINVEESTDLLVSQYQDFDDITELIFFVGFVDKDLFEISTVNWQRSMIMNWIDDDKLIEKLHRTFEFVSYSDLL